MNSMGQLLMVANYSRGGGGHCLHCVDSIVRPGIAGVVCVFLLRHIPGRSPWCCPYEEASVMAGPLQLAWYCLYYYSFPSSLPQLGVVGRLPGGMVSGVVMVV
jgi:hypothetical protein